MFLDIIVDFLKSTSPFYIRSSIPGARFSCLASLALRVSGRALCARFHCSLEFLSSTCGRSNIIVSTAFAAVIFHARVNNVIENFNLSGPPAALVFAR